VIKSKEIIYIHNLNVHQKLNGNRPQSWKEEQFYSYIGVPLISKGNVIGVLELFNRREIFPGTDWFSTLEKLAAQIAIAIDESLMFNALQQSHQDLSFAYDFTLEGWARALELRDKETEGHSRRVTEVTLILAEFMDIPTNELIHIRRGSILHDIGKMGVPDNILLKPGPLNENEWEIMRLHPVYAYDLLSPIDYLRPALDIPYCHHERWDGSGYPRGLKGEEIPLAARIFSIVDVWDALLSNRPYRPAWPEEKVNQYIRDQSGAQFDPEVVKAFFSLHEVTSKFLSGKKETQKNVSSF
jgi:HD-GYP domain-containing protein (c-di-GMP phosphodiesterase class II)